MDEMRQRLDLLGDYIVYVGRIEREKGCSRLFENFLRFVQQRAPHLNLVLVGQAGAADPRPREHHPPGRPLRRGQAVRHRGSRLLVHPSPFESLSMALLEAWMMERPALVNGRCAVLRGQVHARQRRPLLRVPGGVRGGAGLDARPPAESDAMGRAGRAYFERHYSWDVVMEKYERLLALRVPAAAEAGRRLRLCFVIQRYGLEVAGRLRAALPLAGRPPRPRATTVEVVTTCALDYLEWKNHYPPGEALVDGIPVTRFPVERPRSDHRFALGLRPRLPRRAPRADEIGMGGGERALRPRARARAARAARRRPLRLLLATATTRPSSACRRWPGARCWCPRRRRTRPSSCPSSTSCCGAARDRVPDAGGAQRSCRRRSDNGAVPSVVVGSGVNVPPGHAAIDLRARFGICRSRTCSTPAASTATRARTRCSRTT